MNNANDPLKNLADIRSMMERSSRFISLSGLSGIFAGIAALLGAAAAWWYLDMYLDGTEILSGRRARNTDHLLFFLVDAFVVVMLALSAGVFFTTCKARKKGLKIWDNTTRRLVVNMAIPLITGGLFCLVLLRHAPVLIAPATLIFYGLALVNASKYTLDDVRYLGYSQIMIGLTASFLPGFGLLFWAMGFGVMHIVYGWMMYHKYDR
jgi:hypothetical protein